MFERLPDPTTADGLFGWIVVFVLLTAAVAALVLFASVRGWLPPIDRFDGVGSLLLARDALAHLVVASHAIGP